MDNNKKVYVDSRYKTSDSVSNSDFKFEINEALDLPDNTYCYIDDICIPHTWYTIEDFNNTLYIVAKLYIHYGTTYAAPVYQGYALKLSNGNYTGLSLANEIQEILNATIPDLAFTCSYGIATGKISIKAGVDKEFKVFSNFQVSSIDPGTPDPWKGWRDNNGYVITVDVSNLNSINEVLRNTSGLYDGIWSPMDPELDTEFTSEFLDLLNVHNIYIHSSTLGNYSTIGVRGENTIIKKVPVSSSFGYLIMDSVVAPHDKINVSKQLIKTLHFSLRNVHGNVIDLHGSHISLSLIFQTLD